jgi:hypothetical protein
MTTAPVIAGLAAGIGFVVLFAVMFNIVETMPRNSLDVAIAGLKDSYSIREAIDFTVTVKGYGISCGNPNVLIKNASNNATVWSADRIALVLCDPDPDLHDVDIVWKPEDWGEFPIAINEPGSYIVQAEFDNTIVTKEFVVAST